MVPGRCARDEVETERGAVGLGETYGDEEYLAALQLFAARLPGHRLAQTSTLWDLAADVIGSGTMAPGLIDEGQGRWAFGPKSLAKLRGIVVSAFEVAFLDALGRRLEVPVHALLGGKVRDRVDYAAYLFYRWERHPVPDAPVDDWGAALDAEGIVAQARRMVERYGFGSLKLKGGVFEPEQEIAATRALREAFPDRPVRLDPNGIWSVETSVRVATALRDVIEYLEDPCAGLEGMAQVHARTGVPLATNMWVTTLEEIPPAVKLDAVQILLTDHHFWGGLRSTQQLSAICSTFGIGLSMHSNTHLGISLAAITQAAACVRGDLHACDTHRPWQTEDIITEPHRFVDGALAVSDRPGLGVELDRAALDRLHRRWLESDVRTRDDVAAMRAADPEWTAPPMPRW